MVGADFSCFALIVFSYTNMHCSYHIVSRGGKGRAPRKRRWVASFCLPPHPYIYTASYHPWHTAPIHYSIVVPCTSTKGHQRPTSPPPCCPKHKVLPKSFSIKLSLTSTPCLPSTAMHSSPPQRLLWAHIRKLMPLVVVNAHTGGECVLKQNPIPFKSGRFWHSLVSWHLQFLIWHCSALVWSDLHTGGVLKQDPIPFSGT